MLHAHLDFETRSATDLKKSGVYRYCEDTTTGVWGFAWRIGDGRVYQWRQGYPDPTELLQHVANGGVVVAHNAGFERTVWNVVMARTHPHWPKLFIKQQDCTQARAAAVSHPQGLDALCQALETSQKKDREGSALMIKMSRPRSFRPDGTIQWWDSPENIDRLMAYCVRDVLTECEVDKMIPQLTARERAVWEMDQEINDRGIHLDVVSARRAAELVELAKKQADKEMRVLTSRAVPKCSNDKHIVEWIKSRGIECTTVRKDAQEDIMLLASSKNDALVKEVIELRADSKKTSTAKYAAMLKCICVDDLVRGLLAYHGAGPGRWAGRLLQPQNFPRLDYSSEGFIINWVHELFHDSGLTALEIYELIACVHGGSSVLRILSRALRSMINAAPNCILVGGDLSNIEGRVNSWVAGETWKNEAFRAYDEKRGPDLYNLLYANTFRVLLADVDKAMRQIGKVMELASGYQGGVGAYITMGATYGLDPYTLAPPVQEASSAEQWDTIAARYAKAKDKNGLGEREWTAIKILVTNWRAQHPAIVSSWWEYQDAAVMAVSTPGSVFKCVGGKVSYYSDGRCLWCLLPSSRTICYAEPTVETKVMEYIDKDGNEKERTTHSVSFSGMNEKNQWVRKGLYGGLQCENIVQGTARDIMVESMFELKNKGIPLILTVHDELLTMPYISQDFKASDLKSIMRTVPPWASGLPLSAETWEDMRYVK